MCVSGGFSQSWSQLMYNFLCVDFYWVPDATLSFQKHQSSNVHCEAIEAVVTLPKTTGDIKELLNKNNKQEKGNAQEMLRTTYPILYKVFSKIRFSFAW